ncbi:hypothetical protein [Streptomyces sp. SCL15-4]|uniref:hypothetical protein n=1 Tax=Streptomyces sp. SCL15-4 TaxID=2967221 RepID=UPI00398FF40A
MREAAAAGRRAEPAGPAEGTPGAGVRTARPVPYQAVTGARETGAGPGAVRLRDGPRPGALPVVPELPRRSAARVAARSISLRDEPAGSAALS